MGCFSWLPASLSAAGPPSDGHGSSKPWRRVWKGGPQGVERLGPPRGGAAAERPSGGDCGLFEKLEEQGVSNDLCPTFFQNECERVFEGDDVLLEKSEAVAEMLPDAARLPIRQPDRRPAQFCAVVRHCERADDLVGLVAGVPWVTTDDFLTNPKDPPLSDEGLCQAQETGRTLRDLIGGNGAVVHYVVSSPYFRCLQTAVAICKQFGPLCRLLVDYSLGEIYSQEVMGAEEPLDVHGDYPTRSFMEMVAYCKSQGMPIRSKQPIGVWPPWPETLMSARERFAKRFLKYLTLGHNIILVTHADGVGAALTVMPSEASSAEKVAYGGFLFARRAIPRSASRHPGGHDGRARSGGGASPSKREGQGRARTEPRPSWGPSSRRGSADSAVSAGPLSSMLSAMRKESAASQLDQEQEPEHYGSQQKDPEHSPVWTSSSSVGSTDHPTEDLASDMDWPSCDKAGPPGPPSCKARVEPEPPTRRDGWEVLTHGVVKIRKPEKDRLTMRLRSWMSRHHTVQRLLGQLPSTLLDDALSRTSCGTSDSPTRRSPSASCPLDLRYWKRLARSSGTQDRCDLYVDAMDDSRLVQSLDYASELPAEPPEPAHGGLCVPKAFRLADASCNQGDHADVALDCATRVSICTDSTSTMQWQSRVSGSLSPMHSEEANDDQTTAGGIVKAASAMSICSDQQAAVSLGEVGHGAAGEAQSMRRWSDRPLVMTPSSKDELGRSALFQRRTQRKLQLGREEKPSTLLVEQVEAK